VKPAKHLCLVGFFNFFVNHIFHRIAPLENGKNEIREISFKRGRKQLVKISKSFRLAVLVILLSLFIPSRAENVPVITNDP